MLTLLLLLMASQACSVGQRQVPLVASAVGCCEISAWGRLHRVPGLAPSAGVQLGDAGMLRLRGGGRAWIRKTIKAASKKERQRKKRNIDGTNLRASVKLDPSAVPPGLLLKNELENQALLWLMSGCNLDALPTVEPLLAIEEAKLRLQAMPDKTQRVPRTIKSRQQEEDAKMHDGKDGVKGEYEDVGSKGSRSVRPGKGARGLVSAALHKSSIKKSSHIKQGARSSNKGGGMRLRGGGPDMSDVESSSVVSDSTSSVVSSSSSSAFALPVATNEPPAKTSTSARAPANVESRPAQQAAPVAKSSHTDKNAAVHDLSSQLNGLAIGKSGQSAKTSKSAAAHLDRSSSLDSSHSSADVASPSGKTATSDKSPKTSTAPKVRGAVSGASKSGIKSASKPAAPAPADKSEKDEGEFEMGAASSSEFSGSDDDSTQSSDDNAQPGSGSDDSTDDTDMESSSTEDEDEDDSSMEWDEGAQGEVGGEEGHYQRRLVTQLRTNPAAFGLFFDLEVVGKEHIELSAFATASHITCPHPLDLEIFMCEGGCDGAADGDQGDESLWYSIFEQQNSTTLPQIWECEPESPSEYGVLRLERPVPLAPGQRIGVCIRTSHPCGLVLRALQPATAEKPETRPGTGRARFSLGDKADSDGNLALFAGRAMKGPVDLDAQPSVLEMNATMAALVNHVQDSDDSDQQLAKGTGGDGDEAEPAYAFAGMVLYSILKKS